MFGRWKKQKMSKKVQILLKDDEYDLLDEASKLAKKDLSSWIRTAALGRVPVELKDRLSNEQVASSRLDFVHDALNEETEGEVVGAPGEHPILPVAPLSVIQPNHPCRYLNPEHHPNFRGQCEGTCNAPGQQGRVCFWSSPTASKCDRFVPFKIAKRA